MKIDDVGHEGVVGQFHGRMEGGGRRYETNRKTERNISKTGNVRWRQIAAEDSYRGGRGRTVQGDEDTRQTKRHGEQQRSGQKCGWTLALSNGGVLDLHSFSFLVLYSFPSFFFVDPLSHLQPAEDGPDRVTRIARDDTQEKYEEAKT